MQTTLTASADLDTRREARRGLAIYFTILALLSAPIQALIIYLDLDGGANGLVVWLVLISALMFVPTISSVVARLVLKEGFSGCLVPLRRTPGTQRYPAGARFSAGRRARRLRYRMGHRYCRVPCTAHRFGRLGSRDRRTYPLERRPVLRRGDRVPGSTLTRLIDAGAPRPVLASGLIWGS